MIERTARRATQQRPGPRGLGFVGSQAALDRPIVVSRLKRSPRARHSCGYLALQGSSLAFEPSSPCLDPFGASRALSNLLPRFKSILEIHRETR